MPTVVSKVATKEVCLHRLNKSSPDISHTHPVRWWSNCESTLKIVCHQPTPCCAPGRHLARRGSKRCAIKVYVALGESVTRYVTRWCPWRVCDKSNDDRYIFRMVKFSFAFAWKKIGPPAAGVCFYDRQRKVKINIMVFGRYIRVWFRYKHLSQLPCSF